RRRRRGGARARSMLALAAAGGAVDAVAGALLRTQHGALHLLDLRGGGNRARLPHAVEDGFHALAGTDHVDAMGGSHPDGPVEARRGGIVARRRTGGVRSCSATGLRQDGQRPRAQRDAGEHREGTEPHPSTTSRTTSSSMCCSPMRVLTVMRYLPGFWPRTAIGMSLSPARR